MTTLRSLCIMLLLLSTTGCLKQIPADPNQTFQRVQGHELRVGVTYEDELIEGEEHDASGPLAELVETFGQQHDAHITWVWGSEESLIKRLQHHQLDLIVGGFTSETPWSDRVAVTRGYPEIPSSDGRDIVMLVPMGENRMLFELETFLDAELLP